MDEPKTPEEVLEFHRVRQASPTRAVEVASGWIERNPTSATALYSRHIAWMDLGDSQSALADVTKAIELEPTPTRYSARGDIYRHLGQYERAIADYEKGQAMDPARWEENAIPLLYQADAYARAGNEPMALSCCARLPDDFWTPGPNGTPPGKKAEIAEELRRRAAAARARALKR